MANKQFQAFFGHAPTLVAVSPGRINLIGEHTDYNQGFVLPAAIDRKVRVAAKLRSDREIRLYSVEYQQFVTTTVDEVSPTEVAWANYVLGAAAQFQQAGYQLGGFEMLVEGDIPLGAGLSSSAALETAVLMALSRLFGWDFSRLELAKMAQRAEHQFAGVQCGIMDMFACLFGQKDHAIRLDCRSLAYEMIPLNLEGVEILLFDSKVKHALASTAYNQRRQECETGVKLVQAAFPLVESLRDVESEMLHSLVLKKAPTVFRRCQYVLDENERLLAACEALKTGDAQHLGALLFASHEGLSRQYEVSCPELDLLVDAVRNQPGVLGARMMGGGFGGCTLNLVEAAHLEKVLAQVGERWQRATGQDLVFYKVQTSDGTTVFDV